MFEVLEKAVESVASIYFLVLVGFLLDRRRWFSPETKTALSRLVVLVAMPPYLFASVLRTFSREELAQLVYGGLVPIISILLNFVLGWLLARRLRVRRARRGLIAVGIASSNTMFMGLPVNVALFGETALPYVLIYFFASASFFWTLGQYALSLDAETPPARAGGLKALFSPPLLGFGLGVTLLLAGLKPPRAILEAATLLGSLTTPLAMLFIGATLGGFGRDFTRPDPARPDPDLALLLFGRLVTSPLIIILLAGAFGLPPLMTQVFIIQSSLPAAANLAILASYYQSDPAFGARAVSLTTILSLATIPLFMALIHLGGF